MQLITIKILLLIHGDPTTTVYMKLYIYLYEVKRLSNMPKNLVYTTYANNTMRLYTNLTPCKCFTFVVFLLPITGEYLKMSRPN